MLGRAPAPAISALVRDLVRQGRKMRFSTGCVARNSRQPRRARGGGRPEARWRWSSRRRPAVRRCAAPVAARAAKLAILRMSRLGVRSATARSIASSVRAAVTPATTAAAEAKMITAPAAIAGRIGRFDPEIGASTRRGGRSGPQSRTRWRPKGQPSARSTSVTVPAAAHHRSSRTGDGRRCWSGPSASIPIRARRPTTWWRCGA
jgi:hypothetical protein